MNEVFVSYKREDEVRVGRLVKALEGAGLSVWWDRGLAAGESWRGQIQSALDAAKCVVVVWTRESVGPAGDFVREEAGQAKHRGVLVPVKLDRVDLPLGFGETQTIDLTRWKGRQNDPFFEDLCGAVRAKLEGRGAPPAKGPTRRLLHRLQLSSLLSAICVLSALTFNFLGVQDWLCGVPLFQPHLSDACGALALGHRAKRAERIEWERREPGNCAALRSYVERYPDGTFRDTAASLLAARLVTEVEVWGPGARSRRLALFVGREGLPSRDEPTARASALERAQAPAERLCKGFAATTFFRFSSAHPSAQVWRCGPEAMGVICGFEGEAVCQLEERRIQQTETCGR
jgi:hypothetical protein